MNSVKYCSQIHVKFFTFSRRLEEENRFQISVQSFEVCFEKCGGDTLICPCCSGLAYFIYCTLLSDGLLFLSLLNDNNPGFWSLSLLDLCLSPILLLVAWLCSWSVRPESLLNRRRNYVVDLKLGPCLSFKVLETTLIRICLRCMFYVVWAGTLSYPSLQVREYSLKWQSGVNVCVGFTSFVSTKAECSW